MNNSKNYEMAVRIREMRAICGFSIKEMAEKTELTEAAYIMYENGEVDLPFTFIYKCSVAFGVELTDLIEGRSATLKSYTVTRKGEGLATSRERDSGISINNLAPNFHGKLGEPYWVRYEHSEEQQHKPIHTTTHSGQEFDFVLSGRLRVKIGDHEEYLGEGDSIFYKSSTPHGMIAVDGRECVFLAFVLSGSEANPEAEIRDSIVEAGRSESLLCEKYIKTEVNAQGLLQKIDFVNTENFNFAFDILDELGTSKPDGLAMVHLDVNKKVTKFTYADFKRASAQCANYFKSLGIKKGDRVMLVLKRHYQFWFAILGLHKLGAVAIPATNQLQEHDFEYRFNAAGVKAIVCTADGKTSQQVDSAQANSPTLKIKILVGAKREGWHDFNEEYPMFSGKFKRTESSIGGADPMVMFFTSGTTGYPKIATQACTYALGHFITARYWHDIKPGGLHFTISDTGWGKALWGKLYGQWLCEGTIFVYDFDRFDASDILPLFSQFHITSFCAPPTMYRMMMKQDISKYDLSSIHRATIAGEALNPEVFKQIESLTGLRLMEGFGQTETTMVIGNLVGMDCKIGSMGKPTPEYKVALLDSNGNPVDVGESGEICIYIGDGAPIGLFLGYYRDEEKTLEARHDGYYHTGDIAWMDEDGYYWYVGRADDVIKSSGYRIGPFEIESVIMELPYVLECGVSPYHDEVRGQVVKASIVLTKGTEPTDMLKKEIQDYVKMRTAPYKYPRIVVFREELPKTISGKIKRSEL